MKPRFTVRNKSILPFFKLFLTRENGELERMLNDNASVQPFNPYYLMKDTIYFQKNKGIDIGDIVVFELNDRSETRISSLWNIYTYEAREYDDFSIKMVLTEFRVEVDSYDPLGSL